MAIVDIAEHKIYSLLYNTMLDKSLVFCNIIWQNVTPMNMINVIITFSRCDGQVISDMSINWTYWSRWVLPYLVRYDIGNSSVASVIVSSSLFHMIYFIYISLMRFISIIGSTSVGDFARLILVGIDPLRVTLYCSLWLKKVYLFVVCSWSRTLNNHCHHHYPNFH